MAMPQGLSSFASTRVAAMLTISETRLTCPNAGMPWIEALGAWGEESAASVWGPVTLLEQPVSAMMRIPTLFPANAPRTRRNSTPERMRRLLSLRWPASLHVGGGPPPPPPPPPPPSPRPLLCGGGRGGGRGARPPPPPRGAGRRPRPRRRRGAPV